jgi:hypothetical protein
MTSSPGTIRDLVIEKGAPCSLERVGRRKKESSDGSVMKKATARRSNKRLALLLVIEVTQETSFDTTKVVRRASAIPNRQSGMETEASRGYVR